jgi:electron transport complex protein RnfC
MGQMIGDSNAPVSAPIHASVSGKVIAVEPRLHPNGCMVTSVVIENDFNDTLHESVVPKGSVESLSADELIKIIRQAGIVGLGGAAYPTHAKIQSCLGKVDTLIINGSECEPYITSGHRAMLETPEEIIGGIRVLMKIFRVDNAIIGIESNKLDAVRVFEKVLPQKNSPIKVKVLKTKYPQGGEKQLIYAITKRKTTGRCGLRCIQYRHLRRYPQRCDNWHAANHARSHCHGRCHRKPKKPEVQNRHLFF